ncbi:type II secretion system protein [Neptuniibacter sp. QD72_48]|uniref:type II secretion system protein n=1 Tax=unclassified Neptuniibacter TaxID=2630693 RepID=UPI0039F6380B
MALMVVKATVVTSPIGNHQRGFTLLELMVVITLIGLMSGFVVAYSSHSSYPETFESRVKAILFEMSEKSLIDQRWYGLQIDEQRLRVISMGPNGWDTKRKDGWIDIPTGVTLEFEPSPHEDLKGIGLYASPDGLLSPHKLIYSTVEEQFEITGPYAINEE